MAAYLEVPEGVVQEWALNQEVGTLGLAKRRETERAMRVATRGLSLLMPCASCHPPHAVYSAQTSGAAHITTEAVHLPPKQHRWQPRGAFLRVRHRTGVYSKVGPSAARTRTRSTLHEVEGRSIPVRSSCVHGHAARPTPLICATVNPCQADETSRCDMASETKSRKC
jgi:hypothetical protein